MPETAEITQVLHAIGRSEVGATEKLHTLVYAELRRLAPAPMAREISGQTHQRTYPHQFAFSVENAGSYHAWGRDCGSPVA